jgi:hypothetical protein
MVGYLLTSARSIPLLNVYGTTGSPTAIGIMRLGIPPYDDAVAPLDPSPNIHRQRMVVRWYYIAAV